MKKLNYLLLGAAGLLFASCANDDITSPSGDGNVLIKVNLPADLATRALYGEGTQPKQLQYAVFEVNSDGTYTNVISSYQNIGTDMNATLKLNLLSNKNYRIALFAQSEAAASGQVYVFEPANQEIKVNYSNMQSQQNNGDGYDCFYANLSTGTLSANNSATFDVTMTRPVAQINWGTSDLNSNQQMENTYGAGGNYTQTFLTIKEAPTSFNMVTGEMSSATEDVTFPGFAVPGANTPGFDYTYPINPDVYKYLALQYVLTSSTSNVYDITLNVRNDYNGGSGTVDKNINLTGAPLQANYRTNVYGALLSSEADINITVSPDWTDSDNITSTWDGTSSTTPTTSGNYTFIEKASDLAGLAEMVSNGEEDFSGKTIVLVSDFDMNGYPFPGIGNASYSIDQKSAPGKASMTGNSFKGTFDGNGHNISNLKLSANNNGNASFINVLEGGIVQNVTFSNVIIDGTDAAQTGIVGTLSADGKVSNVTVSGSVNGNEYTGAVVGALLNSGTIDGCTNNAVVSGTKYVGGVVGAAVLPTSESSLAVSNCKNTAAVTGNAEGKYVGGVVGISSANVTKCSNSGTVTNPLNSTGGIVGEQRNCGSVTYCVNTGEIKETGNNNYAYGSGGIVGFVRYYPEGYTVYAPISVNYNTNYASIWGYAAVGGIVGCWYMGGNCDNNNNYASTLNAGQQFASGIIGGQQWLYNPAEKVPGVNVKTLSVSNNQTSTSLDNIYSPSNKDLVVYQNPNNNSGNGYSVVGYDTNKTGVAQQTPPSN